MEKLFTIRLRLLTLFEELNRTLFLYFLFHLHKAQEKLASPELTIL